MLISNIWQNIAAVQMRIQVWILCAFWQLDHNNTNYHFEVGFEFFEPALDRFAQFFIAPLFLVDCTDRELQAVDSEYKIGLQSDWVRMYQLGKSLSNPEYPFNSFGIGNLESLREGPAEQGIDVREAFIKFHATWYSANLMKLVVLGRESLDQLEEWVVDKFAGVEDKNVKAPEFEGRPYTEKELQVLFLLQINSRLKSEQNLSRTCGILM